MRGRPITDQPQKKRGKLRAPDVPKPCGRDHRRLQRHRPRSRAGRRHAGAAALIGYTAVNAPLAKFDSAAAMAQALGCYLAGRDFPAVGASPWLVPLAAAVNRLPRRAREAVFAWGGWTEAVSPEQAGRLRGEDVAAWFAGRYPRRRYPGAFIGSSSGALVHLAAALGLPWLPQTALVPVALPGMDPDEPRKSLDTGRRPGDRLVAANPDLQLHHMHDPNQDRLMLQHMSYFRIKRRTLGETYERFLDDVLEPGSTLFLSVCERRWPVTTVGARHYFQFGALGGATEKDYFEGGPAVADHLARYGTGRERWDPPPPDTGMPEAEWGFEPALAEDVARYAAERGHRVRRLTFQEPEHLSIPVANLHRWWYRRRGVPDRRLVAESFILLEPYWALRTGSVPFWMKFNSEFSAAWLERYLDRSGPFDELHLTLFPHGVDSVGLPGIERWRDLIGRARGGGFLGVDERAFPRDFAVLGRFHEAIAALPQRYPMPGYLTERELDRFLSETGGSDHVRWS